VGRAWAYATTLNAIWCCNKPSLEYGYAGISKENFHAIVSPVNLQELTGMTMNEQFAILRRHQLTSRTYAGNCRNAINTAIFTGVLMPALGASTQLITVLVVCLLLLAAWWYARKTLTTRHIALMQDAINNNPGSSGEDDTQIYLDLLEAFVHYKRSLGIEAGWVIKSRDYLATLTSDQARTLTDDQNNLICDIVDVKQIQRNERARSLSRMVVTTTLMPAAIHALQMLGGERAITALSNRATFTNSRRVRAAALRALHALNPQTAHQVLRNSPDVSSRGYSRARLTRPVTVIFRLTGVLVACLIGGICAFTLTPIHGIGMLLLLLSMLLALLILFGALPLLGLEAMQDKKEFQQLYDAISQDDPDSLKLLLRSRCMDLGNWTYYFLLSSVLSNITAKCSIRVHSAQIAVLNQLLAYHLTSNDFTDTHQDVIHTDLLNSLLASLPHIGDVTTVQKLQSLLQQGNLGCNHERVQQCLNALQLRLRQPAELLRFSSANTKQNLVKASSAPELNDNLLKAADQGM
jgi:hypothetical protein